MEESLGINPSINKFNIRVYGIAISSKMEVLLCDENYHEKQFTKFPGGGLEFGEGLVDCLHREFQEELNAEIDVVRHFYTTEFFQRSLFFQTDQLISIYYLVKIKDEGLLEVSNIAHNISKIFWQPLHQLKKEHLTFPIDQLVAMQLREGFLK